MFTSKVCPRYPLPRAALAPLPRAVRVAFERCEILFFFFAGGAGRKSWLHTSGAAVQLSHISHTEWNVLSHPSDLSNSRLALTIFSHPQL